MKIHTLTLAALFLGIGITAAHGRTYEKVVEHAFQADLLEKAEFKFDEGDISLSSADSSNVSVVIRLTIDTASQEKADEAFDELKIQFSEKDGIARTVLQKERTRFRKLFFWRDYPKVEVGIVAPRGAKLKIESGAGDVSLADVEADLEVATGAGDVESRRFTGTINIATGAGDVDLENTNGRINVATGAGDLEASGNITSFDIATGAGSVDLLLNNSLSKSSSIATGAGDIELTLPGNAAFELASDTGWGNISCDFDIVTTEQDKKSLKGTVNGGGPKLSLAVGFGDIDIRAGGISE